MKIIVSKLGVVFTPAIPTTQKAEDGETSLDNTARPSVKNHKKNHK
jgi:hypothetical protein